MGTTQRHTIDPSIFLHPGDIVLDYLESRKWTPSELARRIGREPDTIRTICSGKAPITPAIARALEQAFGRSARLWLNLQRQFDRAKTRRQILAQSQAWIKWASGFPVREMKRLNYTLPNGYSIADSLVRYFGVSSPESWIDIWNMSDVAYRLTSVTKPNDKAVAAWTREVDIQAEHVHTQDFDEGRLRDSLNHLCSLGRGGRYRSSSPS